MAMISAYYKTLFCFFTLLSPLLHTTARLNLDRSDFNALLIVQRDLGVNGQRPPSAADPCNIAGVFCERRLSVNNTYSLKVVRLVFNSQSLTGFISPAIGRFSELIQLSLPNNKLVDRIPSQIVDCKKLEILNLNNNRFSGEIPLDLSSLIRLRVLDLSWNKFSGDLNFLKRFPNLKSLSLANNQFTGKIPISIRSFRNLQVFDFSGNNLLEGSIPMSNKPKPESSEYPKRYILAENSNSNSNPNSTRRRANGPSLSPAQSPTPNPKPHHKPKRSKAKKIIAGVFGFIGGAIGGLMTGFVFSLMFKLIAAVIKGGPKDQGPTIFSPLIKKAEDLAFLDKEDGLTSLELIGKGGCGEVYKAELPGSNGKMIAIKKIVQPPKDATELAEEDTKLLNKKMRQIRSEIQTVGEIRHRNLIPLLAHIPRPDCHLLIYEYMKNGSLQDRLNQVSEGNSELDWPSRHNIALGIASGLEYLHMNHKDFPCIIHRDLKPANILLDDNMEARIADFGLAKAMPDAHTHITTSNVAGTVGYIAPEYHQTLKFTDKCDIYSFGVLIGTLVMGKFPSDEFFQHTDEMSLVKWMRNVIASDDPKRAIDPKLIGSGSEENMLLVLKIACFCTSEDPKQRPNSKDIRCMLEQIHN